MKIIKGAFIIGIAISTVPLAAAILLLEVPYTSALSKVGHFLFGLGLPGMLCEAWVMSAHEPHGGGTPSEMVFFIFPFNILFYSLLAYIVLQVVRAALRSGARIARRLKG